jgi:hypothetical protein
MFTYPTSAAYFAIEPELVTASRAGRLGLQLMPPRPFNTGNVRWTQKDNFYGLQHLRGLDGKPTRVVRVGESTYEYEPGVFGEFIDVTETELTKRAGSIIDMTTAIDVSDIIAENDVQLIGREDDRMESSIWTLLTTGVLEIQVDGSPAGQYLHRTQFTFQTYTPVVPWSTVATATPLRDLQAMAQLGNASGISVDFGAAARLYVNSVTANRLLNNTNASDMGGRLVNNGSTVNTLPDFNRYFAAQEVPQIIVYDRGYQQRIGEAQSSFKKFIADGVGVLIGNRPGNAVIGNYAMTRNASNNFRPGSYRYVVDRANGVNAEKRTPANIEVHRGHNGGPVIYFPSAVVLVTGL